eukprot:TRINITY_DN75157_c0_g1_i1.p1 TRINITY_DN75157_c0_g1~~TRINITY_DN75157_c0_g1_i1.p1  ORF type:complete len:457 (-),score=64.28 TRINITY_DN75157_c0_g1_i1:72-1442(-)
MHAGIVTRAHRHLSRRSYGLRLCCESGTAVFAAPAELLRMNGLSAEFLTAAIAVSLLSTAVSAATHGLPGQATTLEVGHGVSTNVMSLERKPAVRDLSATQSLSQSELVGELKEEEEGGEDEEEEQAPRQQSGLMRREILPSSSQNLFGQPQILYAASGTRTRDGTSSKDFKEASPTLPEEANQGWEDFAVRQAESALARSISKPVGVGTVGRSVRAAQVGPLEYPSTPQSGDKSVAAPPPPANSGRSGDPGGNMSIRPPNSFAPSPKPLSSVLRQWPGVPELPRVEPTRAPPIPRGPLSAATKRPPPPLVQQPLPHFPTPLPSGNQAIVNAINSGGSSRLATTQTTTQSEVVLQVDKSKATAKDAVKYPDALDLSRNLIFETAEQASLDMPPVRGTHPNATGLEGESLISPASTIISAVIFGMVLAVCIGFCCSALSRRKEREARLAERQRGRAK